MGQELELEVGLAVKLVLDVVLEAEHGQILQLAALGVDVTEKDAQVHRDATAVGCVVDVALKQERATLKLDLTTLKCHQDSRGSIPMETLDDVRVDRYLSSAGRITAVYLTDQEEGGEERS